MRFWKWVGLAGLVGVAALGIATGVATVQRHRREFVDAAPDAVRTRLHERYVEAQQRADAR